MSDQREDLHREDIAEPQRYCRWPSCNCDMSQGKPCNNPMPPKIVNGSVNDIPDSELVGRAMRWLLRGRGGKVPLWTVVMEVFALGSNYARELCQRYGMDPDQKVKR